MWYAIAGLVFFVIFLLVSVSNLSGRFDEIKTKGFSTTLLEMCNKYTDLKREYESEDYYNTIKRRRSLHEDIARRESENSLYQNLDKRIRVNARYGIFGEHDITIREALEMLFEYLRLEIKPGGDIKIVKVKK